MEKPKNSCEQYQMDIVDLATGETSFLTGAKQEQLFEHLRRCVVCRKKFFEYEHIFAAMAGEERAKSPAFKKMIAGLLAEFKSQSAGLPCQMVKNGQVIPRNVEVGEPSGVVWKCVAKNGVVKLTNLAPDQAYGGYGWLAHQNKLVIIKDKNTKYICLTEDERRYAQPQA